MLALDHDKILSEVIMAKVKDDVVERDENGVYLCGDTDHYQLYPKNHTFSEDTNIYKHTIKAVSNAVYGELVDVFGDVGYWKMDDRDLWGHVVEPGQQTTIHNHCGGFLKETVSLSFAYYPNYPTNSGKLIFQTQVNTAMTQVTVTPKRGMCLIFNSDIWHHTPANCSRYTRVSISGNVDATQKLLDKLEVDEDYTNPYWKYAGKSDL